MYSKNDYRYYLERRLDSTDFIAHARSHKYIKKIGDRYFYTQQEIAAFMGKDKKRSPGVDEMYRERAGDAIKWGAENTRLTPQVAKRLKEFKGTKAAGDAQDRGRKRTQYETNNQKKAPINAAQNRGKRLTAKTKAQSTIKADQDRGRKRTESAKGAADYKDTRTVAPKNRKTIKGRIGRIRKKYGLYREKPKGDSIGGGITVTHDVKVRDKKVPDKIEYDKIEYDKKVRRR